MRSKIRKGCIGRKFRMREKRRISVSNKGNQVKGVGRSMLRRGRL